MFSTLDPLLLILRIQPYNLCCQQKDLFLKTVFYSTRQHMIIVCNAEIWQRENNLSLMIKLLQSYTILNFLVIFV